MRLIQSLPREYPIKVPLDREGTPIIHYQLSNGYPFTHLKKDTGSYLPAVTCPSLLCELVDFWGKPSDTPCTPL